MSAPSTKGEHAQMQLWLIIWRSWTGPERRARGLRALPNMDNREHVIGLATSKEKADEILVGVRESGRYSGSHELLARQAHVITDDVSEVELFDNWVWPQEVIAPYIDRNRRQFSL